MPPRNIGEDKKMEAKCKNKNVNASNLQNVITERQAALQEKRLYFVL